MKKRKKKSGIIQKFYQQGTFPDNLALVSGHSTLQLCCFLIMSF